MDFHLLMAHKLHAGTTMRSAAPILPQERSRTNLEGMQQQAHLAGLRGVAALPLALLAQWTGAATEDAGSIHDAQAPVSFAALLMRGQFLVCWTPKRSIGLECKVLAREATSLPC